MSLSASSPRILRFVTGLPVTLALGVLVAGTFACKKDETSTPAPVTSTSPTAASANTGTGAIPSAEDFCTHIDKLSLAQLSGSGNSPEEIKQMVAEGHQSCVVASTEDRKNYPEWGPCAACAMSVNDLATMEQKCDPVCKALGEKLEKKVDGGPPH